MNQERLSGVRLRNFFIHVCRTAKAVEEKRRRRAEISEHLESLRKLAKGKDKKKVESEIRNLSSKLDELLEKEKGVERKQKAEDELLRRLQARVDEIGVTPVEAKPIEEFHRVAESLRRNVARIKEISEEEETEKKPLISGSEIKKIENQLSRLEKEYRKLKKTGKEKKRIQMLGSKIKKQKEILKKVSRS